MFISSWSSEEKMDFNARLFRSKATKESNWFGSNSIKTGWIDVVFASNFGFEESVSFNVEFFFTRIVHNFYLFSDRFHHCQQPAQIPKRNPPHRLHHLKKIYLRNKTGQTMGHTETISKVFHKYRPTATAGLLHQFRVYHCRRNERLRKTIRMNSCVHFWPNDRNHPISFHESQLMVFSNSSIRWHHQFGNCHRWRLPGSSPK